MKFIDSLQQRYATKLYDPKKGLDNATINEIGEILRLTPSSINSQAWQFTLVHDPELKAKLAENSFFNRQKIEDAPLLIVFSICSNIERFKERIIRDLPAPNVDYFNNVVNPQGDEAIKSWFTHQVYIAIGVLLSACAVMEIDSTPMEGIDADSYDAILENRDYHTVAAIAVGYRSAADGNQPDVTPKQRRPLGDVVVTK